MEKSLSYPIFPPPPHTSSPSPQENTITNYFMLPVLINTHTQIKEKLLFFTSCFFRSKLAYCVHFCMLLFNY